MDGWVCLNDRAKKVNLSIASKNFALSPFKKNLDPYKIDTEKTVMDINLQLLGDTEKGFHIASNLQAKTLGVISLTKNLGEFRLRTDSTFNLHNRSLIIHTAAFYVNGFLRDIQGRGDGPEESFLLGRYQDR